MTTDIADLVADNIDIWTSAIQRKSGAGRGGGGRRISLYGIERLRALILDLAVRGKLVPQDAGDEPASELLKRIAKAKAGMIREGVIRKSRDTDLKDDLEQPFEIPRAWQWVRLDQIAGCLDYMRIPVNEAERDKRIAGKDQASLYPYFGATQQQGWIDEYLFDDELVLLGEDGVPFFDPLRNKAYAVSGKTWVNNHAHVFKPILVSPHLLAHYLNRFDYSGRIAGTTRTKLNQAKAVSIPTPLPPLAEQRRIVAKVDELMALCDALERESADAMAAHQLLVETLLAALVNSADAADLARQWARLESHFDTLFTTEARIETLKQTILDLAVRGKLVEQDMSGSSRVSTLAKVIGPMDSGWSPACHPYPAQDEETWGVLKTTAVQTLRYVGDENKELPAKLAPRPEAECRAGDILVTRAGPTNRVGIVCYVAETRAKLMISDKIIRFRPASTEIDGQYLALSLSVGPAAAQVEAAKSGMAASQVNISQAKLRAISVRIPPLAEQRRIVAKVDALMALCDALKARLADAAQTQRDLADAITQQAAA